MMSYQHCGTTFPQKTNGIVYINDKKARSTKHTMLTTDLCTCIRNY